MALEPLIAAAFAAGFVEGASILAHYQERHQEKKIVSGEAENRNKHKEETPSLSSLILPSFLYGSIALPMTIIGASPGPSILNFLTHSNSYDFYQSNVSNVLLSPSNTNTTTLTPGKLPRFKNSDDATTEEMVSIKAPLMSIQKGVGSNRHGMENHNENYTKDEIKDERKSKSDIHSITKTPFPEIKISPAAVQRFRDENKRNLQARAQQQQKQQQQKQQFQIQDDEPIVEYDTSSSSSLSSSQEGVSIKSNQKIHSTMRNDRHMAVGPTQTQTYFKHPKLQNLFHLTSFPYPSPNTSPSYYVTRIHSTHPIPPLAEVMKRFRFLFFGTAVLSGITAHYSMTNSSPTHARADSHLDSNTSTVIINDSTNDNHNHANSNIALRFVSEEDYVDKANKKSTTRLDTISPSSHNFQTFPVVISNTSVNAANPTKSISPATASAGSAFHLRLDHHDEKDLMESIPMNSTWLIQTNQEHENNENGSDSSPPIFLLCEADLSIPIHSYLQKQHNHDKSLVDKERSMNIPSERKTLSLESIQVSNRILDMMAQEKHMFPSSSSSTSTPCVPNMPDDKKQNLEDHPSHPKIVNVLIESGPHSLPLTPSKGNYIVVNSLDAVGSSLSHLIENTYLETMNLETNVEVQNESKTTVPEEDGEDKNDMEEEIHPNSTSVDSNETNNTPQTTISQDIPTTDPVPPLSLFTRIGKSIRQSCTKVISQSIPLSLLSSSHQEKIVYIYGTKPTYEWLRIYLNIQGWNTVWLSPPPSNKGIDLEQLSNQIPPNGYVFICGSNDISTIEHTCAISSYFSNSSSPKIFALLERSSSQNMLNMLLEHNHTQNNKEGMVVQSTCIHAIHDEIFDTIRNDLLSGKSVEEIQTMINDGWI